jgi:pSer/pThr/pTyr-binding forkhead associated (FHA) protein
MQANLVLLKKNGSHKTIPLPGNVTVLGRRHDCDLRIPLPTVSRRHCQISQNGEALKIRDLDSAWGTFVNGKKVDGESSVKAGDFVRIGPLMFVCQIDGQPEKIVAPKKAATPPKAKKAPPPPPPDELAIDEDLAGEDLAGGLDDSFADLDASDSVIAFDDTDSDLEDLKDV